MRNGRYERQPKVISIRGPWGIAGSARAIGFHGGDDPMLWLHPRVALLALVVLAGMRNGSRAGDYVYPKAPPVLVKKICYTEWVREEQQCTRTVLKTVYQDEPCLEHKDGCGPVGCTYKVPVQVPVCEKL